MPAEGISRNHGGTEWHGTQHVALAGMSWHDSSMTRRANVTKVELQRMAKIAKSECVEVWIEIDGKRYGVSPLVDERPSAKLQVDEFASLSDWMTWRDKKRALENIEIDL